MNTSAAHRMDRTRIIERLHHIGIWTCLLTALLLIFLLAASCRATAQWSADPTAPMAVCNAANAQRYMKAIADADSGYYVVWSDLRNDPAKADLYGQHFDSEGNALWAANGELLLTNPTKSINLLAPLRMPDGSLFVAYMTRGTNIGGDTVRAMRFDADATALWAEPVVLLTGPDYRTVQVTSSDSCAFVVAYCESCSGGGYGCRMQRVEMDGTAQLPLTGMAMGSNYYGPYTIHPDGAGGILFNIRCGNGAGTCLKTQRFDRLGDPVWPGYIDIADADGLNYAFSTAMGATGTQTAAWEVNGDVRMRRIDTLGTSLWSPAVLATCDLAVYVQQDPAVLSTSNGLFVAWEDNRPPAANSDLYLQKFDPTTGAELWASDGVPVIQFNTYTPATGLIPSDGGAVIATFEGNLDGYSAMRVLNNGTPAWPSPVAFCVPAFNPFYEQRVQLPDGDGGVVAFWENFTGDLYGARIYRNGLLFDDVGIGEATRMSTVGAFPNPAQDRITFQLPNGARLSTIELVDVLGNTMTADAVGNSISVVHLAAGAYTARIGSSAGTYTARFLKQ